MSTVQTQQPCEARTEIPKKRDFHQGLVREACAKMAPPGTRCGDAELEARDDYQKVIIMRKGAGKGS